MTCYSIWKNDYLYVAKKISHLKHLAPGVRLSHLERAGLVCTHTMAFEDVVGVEVGNTKKINLKVPINSQFLHTKRTKGVSVMVVLRVRKCFLCMRDQEYACAYLGIKRNTLVKWTKLGLARFYEKNMEDLDPNLGRGNSERFVIPIVLELEITEENTMTGPVLVDEKPEPVAPPPSPVAPPPSPVYIRPGPVDEEKSAPVPIVMPQTSPIRVPSESESEPEEEESSREPSPAVIVPIMPKMEIIEEKREETPEPTTSIQMKFSPNTDSEDSSQPSAWREFDLEDIYAKYK